MDSSDFCSVCYKTACLQTIGLQATVCECSAQKLLYGERVVNVWNSLPRKCRLFFVAKIQTFHQPSWFFLSFSVSDGLAVQLVCIYTVFQKNRTPKTGWYNFIKLGPLWIISSENASALNCRLTAFEKLDMGWVLTAQFPWQQQHHAAARIQEANTRPELSRDFQLTRAHYQWRKWLQSCVKTKRQHFEQLLWFVLPLIFYCLHWLIICNDTEIKR